MVIYCIELHMVRNGHNVSICIWYEMVVMYRSAYGTKMIFTIVRNGRYKMVMVRNDYNSSQQLLNGCKYTNNSWALLQFSGREYFFFIFTVSMADIKYIFTNNNKKLQFVRGSTGLYNSYQHPLVPG